MHGQRDETNEVRRYSHQARAGRDLLGNISICVCSAVRVDVRDRVRPLGSDDIIIFQVAGSRVEAYVVTKPSGARRGWIRSKARAALDERAPVEKPRLNLLRRNGGSHSSKRQYEQCALRLHQKSASKSVTYVSQMQCQ